MKSLNIKLDSLEKVKVFVNIIGAFDGDFDLSLGRYVVDAKSIMGIYSLDLSKVLELEILKDDEYEAVKEKMKEFLV